MAMSDSDFKSHIDQGIEDVLRTGTPVEFESDGRRLQIAPAPAPSKLDRLQRRPGVTVGDPKELVHIDWSRKWHGDLP